MKNLQFSVIVWMAVVGLLGGCSSKLPVYPSMSDMDAISTIAERQALITSISAECDLEFTDAQGQRISLDGVLLARTLGEVRLRAWKFGQAVFDLTLTDGQAWVILPDEGQGTSPMDLANVPAQRIRQTFDLVGPSYFRTATPSGLTNETLLVRGPALGCNDVVCEIDRRTLTARRFIVANDVTALQSELILDDYVAVDGMVWPMRIRLRSPSGEVQIHVRVLELNTPLPSAAFTPPRRARALP